MDIKGKTILLTGASGGIGTSIAVALAEKGATLVLVGRDRSRLEQCLGIIPDNDKAHHAVISDLTTKEGRQLVYEQCLQLPNGLDILINCAGVNQFSWFTDSSEEDITQVLNTNMMAPMLLCHSLLPVLAKMPASKIINIGSTLGSIGHPGFVSYCASKFALKGFTESLRRELAATAIAVKYVAPRATKTAINSPSVCEMNESLGVTMDNPEVVAHAVIKAIESKSYRDVFLGWPEKLFVKINAVLPRLVDSSLRKQLPIIQHYALMQYTSSIERVKI